MARSCATITEKLVLNLFAHPQEPVLCPSCTITIATNLSLKLPDALLSPP
jgi:hypothetical protein